MNIAKITDYIASDAISLDLKATNKNEVISELSKLLDSPDAIDKQKIIEEALIHREQLGTTGIGKGIAIPHAKTEAVKKLTIAIGRSNAGIDFESLDDKKTDLFFAFASPVKDSIVYLKILARISRLIREKSFREKLLNAKDAKEIIEIINSSEI